MHNQLLSVDVIKGGEFLVKETPLDHIFLPEVLSEEQKMIQAMASGFVSSEIEPNVEKIENQAPGIMDHLFKTCGELGLLGAHMPESYGGIHLDFNTNTLICQAFGSAGSFNTPFAAHTGIGMLPILNFGTEAQKQKYLPGLISGDLKAAYCLTEPGSGSDALAAKTRADLSSDGNSYVLNGQKMWISNAGFADIFIVFAKIGGTQFTGFIVERNTPGLTFGEEEKKLGIKGSSTRQVFFENVNVPLEQLLGEIGKGHRIAFNALNMGRFKLGAFCIGGNRKLINRSMEYAKERVQFGKSISSFGAIKYKIAEQIIRDFAAESGIFRISNLIHLKIEELVASGLDYAKATLQAAQEYALECSITKIAGSESLDYVVDETLQIHGGIGYSEELPIARAYRDSRINRIYEGTNEINRLLIIDMLFKKALNGEIDLVNAAWEVQKELTKMPSLDQDQSLWAQESKAVTQMKKLVLMTIGAAGKFQMDGKLDLQTEQEIMMNGADMIIDTYLAESILLRILKLNTLGLVKPIHEAILKVFLWDATQRVVKNAKDAISSFVEGDLHKTFMMGIKRFDAYPPPNVKNLRRMIADHYLEHGY